MDIALLFVGLLGVVISVVALILQIIIKRGLSKKLSGLIFLGSFVMIIIAASIGVSSESKGMDKVTANELETYAAEGQYGKLVRYINYYDKEGAGTKQDLIKKSISLIVQNKALEQMKQLEEIFYDGGTTRPEYLYLSILECYNNNNVQFQSAPKLCDYYINKCNNENIKLGVLTMLRGYENAIILDYFWDVIKGQYDSGEIGKAIETVESLKVIDIGDNQKLGDLIAEFNSYEDKVAEIHSFEMQISELESAISKNKSSVPSGKIINLHGYMIQQIKPNYYEFAFTEYDNFLGEIPSNSRGLLKTVETQFQSKGIFDLLVVEDGKEDVVLTEDAGRFNQTWVVYREVPKSSIKKVDQLNNIISERDSLVVQLENRKMNLNYIKDQINNILPI